MATITIDVIKMRQTQDKNGHVLMLRLNPADEQGVAAVSLTPCGAQFKMDLTDLNEDGNADPGHAIAPGREAGTEPQDKPVTALASRLTRLAGMACNDPVFWRYLADLGYIITDRYPKLARDQARHAVYDICDVKSRKAFIVGTPAGDRWLKLYDAFALWRNAPEAA